MSKHTPGPWIACDNNGYSIWRVTSPEYRAESASRTVAEVVGDSAETETNARLIAAAPEMYELIQLLAESTKQDYAPSISGAKKIHALHLLQEAAEKLLAKIEGGGE